MGMEPKERASISLAATKHVAALARAVEMRYGLDAAYAVDGSDDAVEPRGDGEEGAKATAWGSWDGAVARGGALPPGVGNQLAELVAIERTLSRHGAGDRVLLLCDCQAAMDMVEQAWRGGKLGPTAPTASRLGGLVVEAITRHRIRIAEDGGFACFMWVKAHGGGTAPNAYADAIAKSHLAAQPEDVPLHELHRACVYAVTATTGDGRRWAVAADRPLRQLMIERLSEWALGEWQRASERGAAAAEAAARGRHDGRLLAAVMATTERPPGGTPGGGKGTSREEEPTATGRAMRTRGRDCGLLARDDTCELCGQTQVDGGHALRCVALGSTAGAKASEVAEALEAAAAEVRPGAGTAPGAAATGDWEAAARAAGVDGAAAMLRRHPREQPSRPGAEAWAAGGWRRADEEYRLALEAGSPDAEKAAWCAVAVRRAAEAAVRKVRERVGGGEEAWGGGAAMQAGAGAAWAAVHAAVAPLSDAGAAVGAVSVDGDGTPRTTAALGATAPAGVLGITMTYAQLRAAPNATRDGPARIEEWGGEEGQWLRRARATTTGWSVNTQRSFRRGGGAARRKGVVTAAVSPEGWVYSVTSPARWPHAVTYIVDVRGGVEAHDTAGGDDPRRTRVTVKLRAGEGGRMMAEVCAEARMPDGSAYARPERRTVVTPLEEGEQDRGLVALFWVSGWAAPQRPDGGLASTARETAAMARSGALRWDQLCQCLGGELPRLSPAEAAAERTERKALSEAEERAKAGAKEAARLEREAWVLREAAGGQSRAAGAEGGGGEERDTSDFAQTAAEVEAAASLLGVPMDAPRTEVRAAYLRRALGTHPDKGGGEAAFRAVKEAMECMGAHTPEVRSAAAADRKEAAARRAEAEAARAAARTTMGGGATASAEEAEAKWSAAEQARREASRRAEEATAAVRAWTPTWRRVAARVNDASAAYFEAWQAHRRQTRRARRHQAQRPRAGRGVAAEAAAAVAHRAATR